MSSLDGDAGAGPRQGRPGQTAGGADLGDDLKTRAAWLYYMEGMTQDQVAREMDLTRTKVLRMLAAAREEGIVQVRVTARLSRCVELERAVERRFRLDRAVVIPRPRDEAATEALIGATLGAYVDDRLRSDLTLGLGWGRTLSASLASIGRASLPGVGVVSLLGGLTRVSGFNPSEFAWRFADRLGAECHLMAAPVFAPDRATRDALMRHPGIEEIVRRASRLDLAIVSVGDLSPRSIFGSYGLLERAELASLEAAGAVGDVLCRFIDAEGNVVDHPVNDRVVAVDPRSLRSAGELVLASGGWHKYPAVRAALRMLRPNVLITDEAVAERLSGSAD